jgi:hypothetical protein
LPDMEADMLGRQGPLSSSPKLWSESGGGGVAVSNGFSTRREGDGSAYIWVGPEDGASIQWQGLSKLVLVVYLICSKGDLIRSDLKASQRLLVLRAEEWF